MFQLSGLTERMYRTDAQDEGIGDIEAKNNPNIACHFCLTGVLTGGPNYQCASLDRLFRDAVGFRMPLQGKNETFLVP